MERKSWKGVKTQISVSHIPSHGQEAEGPCACTYGQVYYYRSDCSHQEKAIKLNVMN